MFYICVICDCVCVLKYAIYHIWPRQFSFGPDSSHLAHVFLIWLIPWPEQKMSQRGPYKALGPDELHPRILKELATELGPVFAHLFQQSIDTGEIPKEWSLANICPLFKKSDRSLACNYRLVFLTCVPCK